MIEIDGNQFPKMQRRVLTNLQAEIVSNSLAAGSFIGNEVSLSKRMNVARNTIRFLFDKLERAHVIRRVPRQGAFLENLFQLTNNTVTMQNCNVCYYRWCDSLLESEVSSELNNLANRLGIPLKMFDINQDAELLVRHLDSLSPKDKAILIPPTVPAVLQALGQAVARGVRILLLDRTVENLTAPSIVFDHFTGAVLAVRHLLQTTGLPVWYCGFKKPTSSRKRYDAWFACMQEFGYANAEDYIVPFGDMSSLDDSVPRDYYRRKVLEFFRKANPLGNAEKMAIFCMEECLAQDVYVAAKEFGFEIGRQVFVATIGCSAMLEHLNPPCTNVQMDYSGLVRNAETFLSFDDEPTSNYCRIVPMQKLRVFASSMVPANK
ncbi:MAG: substrate-binding domain-containing protein [Victivallales bacterium]|nr:substrate-binding domain-containing protein [Victivallales bacterium]